MQAKEGSKLKSERGTWARLRIETVETIQEKITDYSATGSCRQNVEERAVPKKESDAKLLESISILLRMTKNMILSR